MTKRFRMALSLLLFLLMPFANGRTFHSEVSEHFWKILYSSSEITVLLQEQKPFTTPGLKAIPQLLDVFILENFAHKFNSKVDYFVVNESFYETFTSRKNHNKYSDASLLRYDDEPLDYFSFLLFSSFHRKSDILIGPFNEGTNLDKWFQPSHYFYYDELKWCIQKSRPIPIWQNFFRTCFDPVVWTIFGILYIIYTSLAYTMQWFDSDVQPKWDFIRIAIAILASFVGFVYPYKPTSASNRVCYIVGCFSNIIFVSSFISIMMKNIHKQLFHEQIESIQEIVNSQHPFDLVGDNFALQQLSKHNEVLEYKTIELFQKICQFFGLFYAFRLIRAKCWTDSKYVMISVFA